MSDTTNIIMYRNPIEKLFWESILDGSSAFWMFTIPACIVVLFMIVLDKLTTRYKWLRFLDTLMNNKKTGSIGFFVVLGATWFATFSFLYGIPFKN